jgi:AcrR family transcriptional regulator
MTEWQPGRVRAPFRRLPPDQRRAEILDAALELFSERGEDGVSIDEIGAAAGASRNSVYRCFGSKQELFMAAMARLVAKLTESQNQIVADTPSQLLAARLHVYFDIVEQYSEGYAALIRMAGPQASGESRLIIEKLRARSYADIYDGLGITTPSPVVEAAVHGWVATKEWMAVEWVRRRHITREDVEGLLVFFLGAMLAGAAARDPASHDWLLKWVDSESVGSPFGTLLSGAAGNLLSEELVSRLAGFLG